MNDRVRFGGRALVLMRIRARKNRIRNGVVSPRARLGIINK
jgi:hypothetical protein